MWVIISWWVGLPLWWSKRDPSTTTQWYRWCHQQLRLFFSENFHQKDERLFFSENMIFGRFRKNNFTFFDQKFPVPARVGTQKIFIKKMKDYFFMKTWFLGISGKKYFFYFFDENCLSPIARWDSKNFHQKVKKYFFSENMIYERFRKE